MAETTATEPESRDPGRRLGLALGVGLLVFAGIGLLVLDHAARNRFVPGTTIGVADVGGMTVQDAEAVVAEVVEAPLRRTITLSGPDFEQDATAWDLGMRVSAAELVRDALQLQKQRPMFVRAVQRIVGGGATFLVEAHLDEAALTAHVSKTASALYRPPTEATVEVVSGALRFTEPADGRRLDVKVATERLRAALDKGADRVVLPVAKHAATVVPGKVILVRTEEKRLYLYDAGKVVKSWAVATGQPGYATPTGSFHITAKRKNPTWGNPGSPWARNMPRFIGPGPNNPLGTRAMNLSVGHIRIHGTADAASIGTAASRGCIRMHLAEAEELFDLISVGTPVYVVRS